MGTIALPIPVADFHRAGHPPAFAYGQPDVCPMCPRRDGRVPLSEAFDALYHVPKSQVYAGSRGGQTGNIHLHVKPGEAFEAGRIRRVERQSLCGRRGWYEREAETTDTGKCPRCIEIGTREGGRLTALVKP